MEKGAISIILALSAIGAYVKSLGFKSAPDGLTANFWELYAYLAALLALALSFGASSYRTAAMVLSGVTIAAFISIFAFKVWLDRKSWAVEVINQTEQPITVVSIEHLPRERPNRDTIGAGQSNLWRQGSSPVPNALTIVWSVPDRAAAKIVLPVPKRPRDAYGSVVLILRDGKWELDWSLLN